LNISLTKTVAEDLDELFIIQLNKEANHLAAFTSKDPADKAAYLEKFTRLLNDPTINTCTIRYHNAIAGSIAKFVIENEAEITYWIDRKLWGKGIATRALKEFLLLEHTRPIHARAAFDNHSSQKVLERCGFIKTGNDKGFANARQCEIEEYIYRLD
jgi:[ribosomal protein S5]-alanine N-acetyltransferase